MFYQQLQNNILSTHLIHSSVKVWDLRTNQVVKSMSTASTLGPKLCGDALAIKGDLCVTGSLLPENAIELWSIKVGEKVCLYEIIVIFLDDVFLTFRVIGIGTR